MKTTWDFSLFYDSIDDGRIESDISHFEQRIFEFEKDWKEITDFSKPQQLIHALNAYESVWIDGKGLKPLLFFHYHVAVDSSNTTIHAKLSLLMQRLTAAENRLLFFPLRLGKIAEKDQKKLLSDEQLKKYHYYLERTFLTAKHDLSEEEEKISNLLSLPSYALWTQGVEKALNSRTIHFEGTDIPLSEAQNKIPKLPTKQRRSLHIAVLQKAAEVGEFSESEINAIVTRKKLEDELRSFSKPYESRVISAQNEIETIERLVDVVTKAFPLAHKFYALKAKLLQLPHLSYADRAAQVGKIERSYTFDESYRIIRKTFDSLDPQFGNILERMVENGQIDVFPKKGKQGGAFCSHGTNTPTVVLLNHVNTFESVTTFAHEMGHAIHSELSKSQPVLYQDYSLATAETASTFFEHAVFEELIKDFKEEEKIIALHDKLTDDVNTIFRQIAVFNFELELHTQTREKGFISKEDIASLLNHHMMTYLGPKFKLTPLDGNFFIVWPHLRNFFYVYTYAFGQLVSQALYAHVREDKRFISKVTQFLKAGGSNTPENIFSSIGIDVQDPQFFQSGLETIEIEIEQLRKLVANDT